MNLNFQNYQISLQKHKDELALTLTAFLLSYHPPAHIPINFTLILTKLTTFITLFLIPKCQLMQLYSFYIPLQSFYQLYGVALLIALCGQPGTQTAKACNDILRTRMSSTATLPQNILNYQDV